MSNSTEEMMREVYEFYTGRHWCDMQEIGTVIEKIPRQTYQCKECGYGYIQPHESGIPHPNPPLSTSIDAWADHIFRKMDLLQVSHHSRALQELTGFQANRLWLCTVMHHLQAAYNVIKGE